MKDLSLNRFTFLGRRKLVYSVLLMAALAVLLVRFVPRASAQQNASNEQATKLRVVPGKSLGTFTPNAVREVSLDSLPQMSASATKQVINVPVRFPEGAAAHQARVGRVLREGAFQVPSGSSGPIRQPLPSSSTPIPATPGASTAFLGLDETCSFLTPSDMGLAAGPAFVVQVINSCLVVTDKNGIVQFGFPKSLNSFLGCPNCFLFDPRLTYDWTKGHWIMVVDSFQNGSGLIFVAASAGTNPTGIWRIHSIPFDGANGDLADFPTLGFDRSAIYVGFNDFQIGGGFTNELWILNKSKVEAGIATGPTVFSGFAVCTSTSCAPVDTLQPVNVYNPNDQPRAEYIVNSFNGATAGLIGCGSPTTPCNGLVVWSVSNPLGGIPNVVIGGSIVNTPSGYVFPTPATQPGCTDDTTGCMIETLDLRISGNVYYNHGSFYPTLETSLGGGENSTFTWELSPVLSRDTNSLIIGDNISKEIGYYTGGVFLRCTGSAIFGDAIPNSEGDLTMVFGFTSTCDNPGLAYVSERVSEVPFGWWGEGDGGFFLVGGQAVYTGGACNNSSCTQRWGDYSGGSPDIQTANQVRMWFSGMFTEASGFYGTAIGRNEYTAPSQP